MPPSGYMRNDGLGHQEDQEVGGKMEMSGQAVLQCATIRIAIGGLRWPGIVA